MIINPDRPLTQHLFPVLIAKRGFFRLPAADGKAM
jgi:hypothetical protein